MFRKQLLIAIILIPCAVLIAQDGFNGGLNGSSGGGGGGPVINGHIYDSYRGDGTFGHTFARGTTVLSDPFLWSQTWNDAAVDFESFVISTTRTASSVSSTYFSVKKNGAAIFSIDDNNGVFANSDLKVGANIQIQNTTFINSSRGAIHFPASTEFAYASNSGGVEYTIKAGAAPALDAGCGTGATISGTNSIGRVTIGSTPGATCTLTFSAAWTNAPHCDANNESVGTLIANVVPSTTTLVLTATLLNTNLVSYHCIGWQ